MAVTVGQEFRYIGIDYKIVGVTDTHIEYQRARAGKYDPKIEMRIGSSKFVTLFGGDKVELPTPTARVIKPKAPLIVEDEDDESDFPEGPINTFLMSIVDASTAKDKLKALKEGLFDFEDEQHLGKMFLINCAIDARRLVFAEAEDIQKDMLEYEGTRALAFTEELFEYTETLLGKSKITKAQMNELIALIPMAEQELIAYALGGWSIDQ